MEIVKGQIVISRAGRDVTHVYMVVGADGERILLADGNKRTLAAPKRKNARHLNTTNTMLEPDQADTDLKLKKALADYAESHGLKQKSQGG